MNKNYFNNLINKFSFFFNRKRKKAGPNIKQKKRDIKEEETSDDIYPLW
jgi:hypothetical protein